MHIKNLLSTVLAGILTVIDSYLKDHGAKIDEDVYAISELLQWLFRSKLQIADGLVPSYS